MWGFCILCFSLLLCLVVSTSAIDCLERLLSEMTYYVSSGALNPTHSLHCQPSCRVLLYIVGNLCCNDLHVSKPNNICTYSVGQEKSNPPKEIVCSSATG